uniref:Uncharacterized protein n=1 Tax=Panagrolaimus sp. JU765 TaxID=591449 RepID=A0AC34QJ02_9BILA
MRLMAHLKAQNLKLFKSHRFEWSNKQLIDESLLEPKKTKSDDSNSDNFDECNCALGKQCCVHVNCIDDNSIYQVDTKCLDICPMFYSQVYEQVNVYFPMKKWKKRKNYEKFEGNVENSCIETKYFVHWLEAK